MEPLRIAFPMLTLVPGEMGGTETYARELLQELGRRDDVDVTGFVGAHAEGAAAVAGVREVVVRSVHGGAASAQRARAMLEGLRPSVSRLVSEEYDVVHYPFTAPVPPAGDSPSVVTLHDVQHLDLPSMFSRSERLLRRLTYDRAARRADAVITVSNFARERIVAQLGIDPVRVRVAPLGISPVFRPSDVQREDFVLYPARRWPHKNHASLISAMALVRRQRPSLRLILTGGGTPLVGVPPWVEQRGTVSESDLVSLYQRAACLAYPSLYEGFGLPPLEAMATGCPVAVSGIAPLREVCGEAATYFDPLDVSAIARAVLVSLASPSGASAHGVSRASQFTWERCATAHVDTYRQCAK